MRKIKNLFLKRYWVHWLILTINIVLPFLIFPEFAFSGGELMKWHLSKIPLLIAFYSLNLFWFLPSFLFKGKYISYLISLLSILTVYVLISTLFQNDSFNENTRVSIENRKEITQDSFRIVQRPTKPPQFGNNKRENAAYSEFNRKNHNYPPRRGFWFGISIPLLVFIALGTTYELILRSEKQKVENEELQKEKAQAELAMLKFQMEPHFLFNSLNGIYSLALNKHPDTDKSILILSEMMRYILEESKNDVVNLDKEIDYIANFISMQKLKMASSDNIKIHFEYPPQGSKLKISPMIFIPFVENAFKYGVSYNQPCEIIVQLSIEGSKVKLLVHNNKFPLKATDNSNGIGLANVQRRLKLLYDNKHKISIEETSTNFTVNLSIETS